MQRLDLPPRGRDRFRAVEHRKARAVLADLAVLELDQLAALLGEAAAEDVVGRGLDAEHVETGLQALPLDQAGQGLAVEVEADAEAARAERGIDQGCRRHAVRRRDQVVLIDLLAEVGLGRTLKAIADPLGAQVRVHRMDDRAARQQELGALVEHRPAEIVVVEQHVRGRTKAPVLDPVGDADADAAERRLDPPDQHQVLAEHRHLGDLALGPQRAAIALPALAVAQEPPRNLGDPAVQRIVDRADAGIDVARGVRGRGRQRVVEPAGRQEAGERPQEAPAAALLDRGQRRVARPGRRAPADRDAAILGREQVEAAIERDPEAQAGAGAEVEQAHAALRAVGELEQLDARDLRQGPAALGDGALRPATAEQFDHAASRLSRGGTCDPRPVTLDHSAPATKAHLRLAAAEVTWASTRAGCCPG